MDLSLESTIGIAPVIAVWLVLPDRRQPASPASDSCPVWTADPRLPARRHRIGAVNGFLILKLRLNGFIVTLGMLTMLRGLHIGISEGKSITELPESFPTSANRLARHPRPPSGSALALFALGGSGAGLLRHGRALYAIGGNPEAARAAGIRVDRIIWVVLILGGVLAAFAGILYSGHYGSVAATQGNGWIFQVFAAAVIGGVSLNGGRGTSSAPSPAS